MRFSQTLTSRMGAGLAKRGNRGASTLIEYFGVDNKVLFSSFVPASPGDGSLSFFGIVFDDARIARVRITTGDRAPGPDDDGKNDIVVMDDFIYGEPVKSTPDRDPSAVRYGQGSAAPPSRTSRWVRRRISLTRCRASKRQPIGLMTTARVFAGISRHR